MNINVVIVGHIDHGKSTLIGRLLYDSESLPEDKVTEIQKLLEEYKRRFEFAYFLDSFEEELKEERTIDTTRVLFKGDNNYYTIVDVPGHKEFIKNMLTGACRAQVAVLVVSAEEGIQEQTGRHAFLINMLGVKKLILVINKMDLVGYEKEVFQKVKKQTTQLLASLGYTDTAFIPISAMEGDNVYKPSKNMKWYQGPTLIKALDEIEPEETVEKPLRFVIQDIYQLDSEKVAVGRVESGIIKKRDNLVFQPSKVEGSVNKIIEYPDELDEARLGDSIGIVLDCEVKRGDVGGHSESPPKQVDNFTGEVVLLEGTMKAGDEFEIKCGTNETACKIEDIKERINSETGEIIRENTDEIGEHEAATIIFKTEPLVVEKFADIPELGRFVLARKGKNIGAGVVLEVEI